MSWRSMEIVSEEEKSSRKNDHPLFWIVETLADFRPVRTDFIDELMNMVSDSPEALFARERLALRHLEDLFGVPDANVMDPNWKAKKFGFEERAEDVHRRVLQEEGVEKFADHKNVPWKKILEFGQGVFSKSRKAVDLKEKWRRL